MPLATNSNPPFTSPEDQSVFRVGMQPELFERGMLKYQNRPGNRGHSDCPSMHEGSSEPVRFKILRVSTHLP